MFKYSIEVSNLERLSVNTHNMCNNDWYLIKNLPCADPESFVRGGSNFDNVFLVDEERKDPNTTISGPSSACQQNAI